MPANYNHTKEYGWIISLQIGLFIKIWMTDAYLLYRTKEEYVRFE